MRNQQKMPKKVKLALKSLWLLTLSVCLGACNETIKTESSQLDRPAQVIQTKGDVCHDVESQRETHKTPSKSQTAVNSNEPGDLFDGSADESKLSGNELDKPAEPGFEPGDVVDPHETIDESGKAQLEPIDEPVPPLDPVEPEPDENVATWQYSPESTVEPLTATGLTNLYRVSSELYRSGQPVELGLTSAQTLGIQCVMNFQLLTVDVGYEKTEQTGLTLIHVPLIPWSATQEQFVEALKVFDHAPKPVLVHCLHGADRTGTFVALYRVIYQNWSKEAAKEEMIHGGYGYHEDFSNLLVLIDELDVEAVRQIILDARSGDEAI